MTEEAEEGERGGSWRERERERGGKMLGRTQSFILCCGGEIREEAERLQQSRKNAELKTERKKGAVICKGQAKSHFGTSL